MLCCFGRLASVADGDLDASQKSIGSQQQQRVLSTGFKPWTGTCLRITEDAPDNIPPRVPINASKENNLRCYKLEADSVHGYHAVVDSIDACEDAAILLLLKPTNPASAAVGAPESSPGPSSAEGIDLDFTFATPLAVAGAAARKRDEAAGSVLGIPGPDNVAAGQREREQQLLHLHKVYGGAGGARLSAQHLNPAAQGLFHCTAPADYQALLTELVASEPQLAAALRDCCQAALQQLLQRAERPVGRPQPLSQPPLPPQAPQPGHSTADVAGSGASGNGGDGTRSVLVANHPRHHGPGELPSAPLEPADLTLLLVLQALLVQMPPPPPLRPTPAAAAAASGSYSRPAATPVASGQVLVGLVLRYLAPPTAAPPATRGLMAPVQRGYAVLAALPGIVTMLTGDGREVLFQNAASVGFMGLRHSRAAAGALAADASAGALGAAGPAAAAGKAAHDPVGAGTAAAAAAATAASKPMGAGTTPATPSSLSGLADMSGSGRAPGGASSPTVPLELIETLDGFVQHRGHGGSHGGGSGGGAAATGTRTGRQREESCEAGTVLQAGGVLHDLFAMAPPGHVQELLNQVAAGRVWRGIIPVPSELALGARSRHDPWVIEPGTQKEAAAPAAADAGDTTHTSRKSAGELPAACLQHSDQGVEAGGIASRDTASSMLRHSEETVYGAFTNAVQARDTQASNTAGGDGNSGGGAAAAASGAASGPADAAAGSRSQSSSWRNRIRWPWLHAHRGEEDKSGKCAGGGSGMTRGSQVASFSSSVAQLGVPGARRLRFSLSMEGFYRSAPQQPLAGIRAGGRATLYDTAAAAVDTAAAAAVAAAAAGGSIGDSEQLERSASAMFLSTSSLLPPASSAQFNVHTAAPVSVAAILGGTAASENASFPRERRLAGMASAAAAAITDASASNTIAIQRRSHSQSITASARRITFGPASRRHYRQFCHSPETDADSLRTSTWGLLETMRQMERQSTASHVSTAAAPPPPPPSAAAAAVKPRLLGSTSGMRAGSFCASATTATGTGTATGMLPDQDPLASALASASFRACKSGAVATAHVAAAARPVRVGFDFGNSRGSQEMRASHGGGGGGLAAASSPSPAAAAAATASILGAQCTSDSFAVADASPAPPPESLSANRRQQQRDVYRAPTARFLVLVAAAAASASTGGGRSSCNIQVTERAKSCVNFKQQAAQPRRAAAPVAELDAAVAGPERTVAATAAAAAATASVDPASLLAERLGARQQQQKQQPEGAIAQSDDVRRPRRASVDCVLKPVPLSSTLVGGGGAASENVTAASRAVARVRNRGNELLADAVLRGSRSLAPPCLPPPPRPVQEGPGASDATPVDDASMILEALLAAPESTASGSLLALPASASAAVAAPPPPLVPVSQLHRLPSGGGGGGGGDRSAAAAGILQYIAAIGCESAGTQDFESSLMLVSGGPPMSYIEPTLGGGMAAAPAAASAAASAGLLLPLPPRPLQGLPSIHAAASPPPVHTNQLSALAPYIGPDLNDTTAPRSASAGVSVTAAAFATKANVDECRTATTAATSTTTTTTTTTTTATVSGAGRCTAGAGATPAAAAAAASIHGGDDDGGGGDRAPSLECCWHEVTACNMRDPVSGRPALLVMQVDVTARVRTERLIAEVLETEHRLLESIFPRHVLEVAAAASHRSCRDGRGRGGGGGDGAFAAASATDRQQILRGAGRAVGGSSESGHGRGDCAGHRTAGGDLHGANVYGNIMQLPLATDCSSLATYHPKVTILFADIVGFTEMCHSVPPAIVMQFLNQLYSRLDSLLDVYGVYKVETIGDCYMVAGGLMTRDSEGFTAVRGHDSVDELHAAKVLAFAKAMLREASKVSLPTTGKPVLMRIGLHSGPVMSGIVGARMPRFCLFGDTVNTASRMESTCRPGCIHVSAATRGCISREADEDAEGHWRPTGGVQVKGKGLMHTYIWQQRPCKTSACSSSADPGHRLGSEAASGPLLGRRTRGGGAGSGGGAPSSCAAATNSLPGDESSGVGSVAAFVGGARRWPLLRDGDSGRGSSAVASAGSPFGYDGGGDGGGQQ